MPSPLFFFFCWNLTLFSDLSPSSSSHLVPVYISGAYDAWPRQSKWPKPFKGFMKRKKIRIYVGEPLHGEDYDNDAHKMTDALSSWMHKM